VFSTDVLVALLVGGAIAIGSALLRLPVPDSDLRPNLPPSWRDQMETDLPAGTYYLDVPLGRPGAGALRFTFTVPVGWEHVEVRVDERVRTAQDLTDLGIQVGDFVAQTAFPVITRSGYVTSRHLDDKAGVAAALTAFKALVDAGTELEVGVKLLITISEEVGHGASSGITQDIAELLSIDAAVVAEGQTTTETGVTVAMQDLHGPFDYHLTRRLCTLAETHGIEVNRDVFRYYRSDVAAALEAGAETRAALLGFGVDATHGHERTHLDSMVATARLLALYLQTPLTFKAWDAEPTGPLSHFPSSAVQPVRREPEFDPEDDDLVLHDPFPELDEEDGAWYGAPTGPPGAGEDAGDAEDRG
jgi:hypothetical protein